MNHARDRLAEECGQEEDRKEDRPADHSRPRLAEMPRRVERRGPVHEDESRQDQHERAADELIVILRSAARMAMTTPRAIAAVGSSHSIGVSAYRASAPTLSGILPR